jgi:hypothetical protein
LRNAPGRQMLGIYEQVKEKDAWDGAEIIQSEARPISQFGERERKIQRVLSHLRVIKARTCRDHGVASALIR